MLREAVGFVADVFEKPERVGVAGESQRLGFAWQENLFLALRQRDDARRLNAERLEGVERRRELPLAAVDEEDVGQRLSLADEPREPA